MEKLKIPIDDKNESKDCQMKHHINMFEDDPNLQIDLILKCGPSFPKTKYLEDEFQRLKNLTKMFLICGLIIWIICVKLMSILRFSLGIICFSVLLHKYFLTNTFSSYSRYVFVPIEFTMNEVLFENIANNGLYLTWFNLPGLIFSLLNDGSWIQHLFLSLANIVVLWIQHSHSFGLFILQIGVVLFSGIIYWNIERRRKIDWIRNYTQFKSLGMQEKFSDMCPYPMLVLSNCGRVLKINKAANAFIVEGKSFLSCIESEKQDDFMQSIKKALLGDTVCDVFKLTNNIFFNIRMEHITWKSTNCVIITLMSQHERPASQQQYFDKNPVVLMRKKIHETVASQDKKDAFLDLLFSSMTLCNKVILAEENKEIPPESVCLKTFLYNLIELHYIRAKERGIYLTLRTEPKLPEFLSFPAPLYEAIISAILLYLIENTEREQEIQVSVESKEKAGVFGVNFTFPKNKTLDFEMLSKFISLNMKIGDEEFDKALLWVQKHNGRTQIELIKDIMIYQKYYFIKD